MVADELKSQSSVIARHAASGAQPAYAQDSDDAQLQRMGKKPVLKVRRLTVKIIIIIIIFFFLFLLFMIIAGRRQGIRGGQNKSGRKTRQMKRRRNYQTNIC
jgi:pilus assembly protein TadC